MSVVRDEKRTKRNQWVPPQALAQNGVNIWQGCTVLECRQSLGSNHALDQIVRLLLHARAENHGNDEVQQYPGCLALINAGST
jgi:hypothetical protein